MADASVPGGQRPAGPAGAAAGPVRVGRFALGEQLGAGAFAQVVRARDEELQDDVAIKLLAGDLRDDPEARRRFLEEARLLRRAASPRVASVLDIGDTADGRPYVVLTLADRGTLADRVRESALPLPEAVRLGLEVALGVADLHRRGILHRDIKPSNILLASDPDGGERVLVADLGLAKRLELASGFTLGAGTPGFAAPEQYAPGGGLDVRADVYSLGALVLALVTGPDGVVAEPSPDAARRRLDEVVGTAMSPERERRHADVTAFATDLASVLDVRRDQAPLASGRRARRRDASLRRRRRLTSVTRLALLVLLLPAIVGASGGWLLARDDDVRVVSEAAGLTVSVPPELAGEVARSQWSVPGDDIVTLGFAVSADLGAWSDPESGEPGLFVAVGVGVTPEEVLAGRTHPECSETSPRPLVTGELTGELVRWSGCPGGAELVESVLVEPSGLALVYVQGANLDDDTMDGVLRSIRLDGADSLPRRAAAPAESTAGVRGRLPVSA